MVLCIGLSGCGSGVKTAAPVDPDLARKTLHITLESWKRGESPAELKQRSPAIIAQDFDWISGSELLDFEIAGPGQALDANLICPVKLILAGADGGTNEKTVDYIVGTDPVLTVFRKMM
jgi:hypothetical protein